MLTFTRKLKQRGRTFPSKINYYFHKPCSGLLRIILGQIQILYGGTILPDSHSFLSVFFLEAPVSLRKACSGYQSYIHCITECNPISVPPVQCSHPLPHKMKPFPWKECPLCPLELVPMQYKRKTHFHG